MLRGHHQPRSRGLAAGTVEGQLLSQIETFSWDIHLATEVSDSVLKTERTVLITGMNFEHGRVERTEFSRQCSEYRLTPPPPCGSGSLFQGLVIWLKHLIRVDQSMLG